MHGVAEQGEARTHGCEEALALILLWATHLSPLSLSLDSVPNVKTLIRKLENEREEKYEKQRKSVRTICQ